jgi:hypothetical protein
MIAALLLSVLPSPSAPHPLAAPRLQETGADVDAQIAAAGTDVAKLMELADGLKAAGNDDDAYGGNTLRQPSSTVSLFLY